jgi:amino acid permease
MTLVGCAFAIFIPNIGDAMTILGATTNTLIGFVMPIVYYLKIEKRRRKTSPNIMIGYIVLVIVCICSVIEIATFIYKKVNNLT